MTTLPVSYRAPGLSSPRFAEAFAKGCGGPITDLDTLQPGDVAMFVTPERWDVLQHAIRKGRTYYYGDHGYVHRYTYYRITRNAYQHDGRGPGDPHRFHAWQLPILPWRKTGRTVLVCPQSDTYFALHGLDAGHWLRQVFQALAAATDRPVKVRWKRSNETSFDEDLADAWAVVSYSSAAALGALLAGVPVFTLAPFAAAYRMGSPDLGRIEDPVYPDDREAFFAAIAANQWTLHEIKAGLAWKMLRMAAEAAA